MTLRDEAEDGPLIFDDAPIAIQCARLIGRLMLSRSPNAIKRNEMKL